MSTMPREYTDQPAAGCMARIPDALSICADLRRMTVRESDVIDILRTLSVRYGDYQHDHWLRDLVQEKLDSAADEMEDDLFPPASDEERDEFVRERMAPEGCGELRA